MQTLKMKMASLYWILSIQSLQLGKQERIKERKRTKGIIQEESENG